MADLSTTLSELMSARSKLFATLPSVNNINQFLQKHTHIIDNIIQNIWVQSQPDSADVSIYATGGYARNELYIHSDVDLILIHGKNIDEQTQQKISDFLMQLWDYKIPISHYIGTIENLIDSAKEDLNRYTNLLEMRHITGVTLPTKVFTKIIQEKSITTFYQEKLKEQKTRHKSYGETSYLLEPNIKESPGGLRDVQTLNWLTLRMHSPANLLTQEEKKELASYVNFFKYLRWILHFVAKRAEERLLFEYQKSIATLLDYPGEIINHRIEKLMNQYYLTTKKSNTLLDIWSQAINEHLQIDTNYLSLSHQSDIEKKPQLILELFHYIADNPQYKTFSVETIRYFRVLSQKMTEYKTNDDFNKAFIHFIENTQNLETALRLMHRYDLLGAYINDFQRLTGRMQYDLFHVYTVDKHLLEIIKMICFFESAAAETSYKTCHQIISQLSSKVVLRLAGLFHDIGKGLDGDHSALGANICQVFAEQHQLSAEQTALLIWLVENHLLMSVTAQKKDIYDPQIIEEFAQQVKTKKRLEHLYLLTVADIIATNPKLWNSWKATLLRQLYNACLRCLQNDSNEYPTHTVVAMTQQHALKVLIEAGYNEKQIHALWQHWQEKYFLRHSPQSVVRHTKAILDNHTSDATILVNELSGNKTIEVFVFMRDKSLIIANTTSLFDKFQLSIAEAQILTASNDYTLDSYVLIKTDSVKLNLTCHQIQQSLLKVLNADLKTPTTNKRFISRRQRHFTIKTTIKFQYDNQNNRTMMSLVTTDTTGLIATLTKAFAKHKVQIQHAKIATMGERAEDTFFIVDKKRQPLSDILQKSLYETIIKLLGE